MDVSPKSNQIPQSPPVNLQNQFQSKSNSAYSAQKRPFTQQHLNQYQLGFPNPHPGSQSKPVILKENKHSSSKPTHPIIFTPNQNPTVQNQYFINYYNNIQLQNPNSMQQYMQPVQSQYQIPQQIQFWEAQQQRSLSHQKAKPPHNYVPFNPIQTSTKKKGPNRYANQTMITNGSLPPSQVAFLQRRESNDASQDFAIDPNEVISRISKKQKFQSQASRVNKSDIIRSSIDSVKSKDDLRLELGDARKQLYFQQEVLQQYKHIALNQMNKIGNDLVRIGKQQTKANQFNLLNHQSDKGDKHNSSQHNALNLSSNDYQKDMDSIMDQLSKSKVHNSKQPNLKLESQSHKRGNSMNIQTVLSDVSLSARRNTNSFSIRDEAKLRGNLSLQIKQVRRQNKDFKTQINQISERQIHYHQINLKVKKLTQLINKSYALQNQIKSRIKHQRSLEKMKQTQDKGSGLSQRPPIVGDQRKQVFDEPRPSSNERMRVKQEMLYKSLRQSTSQELKEDKYDFEENKFEKTNQTLVVKENKLDDTQSNIQGNDNTFMSLPPLNEEEQIALSQTQQQTDELRGNDKIKEYLNYKQKQVDQYREKMNQYKLATLTQDMKEIEKLKNDQKKLKVDYFRMQQQLRKNGLKQDFKKVDLLGSGKKNTKIYKALHQPSGKYYALKEVEAKTLDKLNEYKEEAVQLFKAQTHPNIIQFYGYFFYETMYNTFRIGIVCEYIEHKMNLEYVFRKRKQLNVFWKQDELEKMITSLIKTLSYMQTVGLCHRDLKPANLFLMNNGEIKVIDFGESKDYFMEADDGGEGTNATIRGTPQYLSPILWKAHVVDGNSRFAKHNIYKSDVFSVGLLFYQLASMEDVTGFNQKSPEFDGEKLIDQGLKKLKSRYNDSIIEVLRLMLKFHEVERPSFIELEKLILASESSKQLIDTTVVAQFVSVKAANAKIQLSNQKQALKENIQNNENKGIQKQKTNMLAETPIQHKRAKSNQNFYGGNNNFTETSNLPEKQYEDEEMVGNPKYNLLTQAELFKNYNEQNQLYTHQSMKMWWFEFGGNKIGRILLDITQAPPMKEDTYSDCTRGNGKSLQPASNAFRWKLIGKYKNEFPQHFTMVFLSEEKGVYILGGNGNHNTCLYYDLKTIKIKAPMPQEKTFFAAIFHKGIIYTFGGYDAYDKVQISNCEYYNVDNDQWHNSPHDNTEGNVEYKLHKERSQCSCCVFDDETIFIFGGYHRSEGTLNSIEKFNIKTRKIELMELKMPSPLRRFQCLKISQTKILLLGGILRMSKESDAVFCFDLEKEYTIEQLDKIEKPGIIDYPIILDQIGNLHLFLETNSGTSPPAHVVYSFLEYS